MQSSRSAQERLRQEKSACWREGAECCSAQDLAPQPEASISCESPLRKQKTCWPCKLRECPTYICFGSGRRRRWRIFDDGYALELHFAFTRVGIHIDSNLHRFRWLSFFLFLGALSFPLLPLTHCLLSLFYYSLSMPLFAFSVTSYVVPVAVRLC